jgi:putative molybdopterin biosynthesis protein
MSDVRQIEDFGHLKVMADPRRMQLLRMLMAAPATLTQLGNELNEHPAKIRHHLKLLEDIGFVRLVETRIVGGYVEKYYRATSSALMVNLAVLPQGQKNEAIVVSGSNDLALEQLADNLCQDQSTPDMFALSIGSLDGLIALRQGISNVAGCHLFDPSGDEYNTSYVRHFFPGQEMHIITLAHRQQGLLVEMGNPRGVRSLEDLLRTDLTYINRNRGSGTRFWLDHQLKSLKMDPTQIQGYHQEVNTHSQVAQAVFSGQADVGLGVLAATTNLPLDFIPLFEERYDLVMQNESYENKKLMPLLDLINSGAYREILESLEGYSHREAGSEILIH